MFPKGYSKYGLKLVGRGGTGGKFRRLPLPNQASPHETPASILIDIHYANLQVRFRWTWERYCRLAAFLNYTIGELASVICLEHSLLRQAEKYNKFPGPACLHLTLLEARAMRLLSTDIIANPFPPFHD